MLDVRTYRSADIGSDHNLVIAKLKVRFRAPPKNKSEIKLEKYDVARLKEQEIKYNFELELKNRFEQLEEKDDIDKAWTDFVETTNQVAKQTIGQIKSKKKRWMSDETRKLIDERGKTKARADTDPKIKKQYQTLNKKVKRSLKTDKKRWLNSLADEAEQAANKGKSRKLYSIFKEIVGNNNKK